MPKDNTFEVTFNDFYVGAAPFSHLDPLTHKGNSGNYSVAQNIDIISKPGLLTQGPALTNLVNGNQSGVVSELINFILDTPPIADTTYGIGNTKLFKISSTTVISGGTPSWPKTITGATAGKSIAYLKGVLYYFFNTATDSTIGTYDLGSTFNDAWQTGLVKATLIPVATKEDILLFGHGRYVGTYFSTTATINKTKLDFGNNTDVVDIVFNANQWFLAVNSGITGTNRSIGQVYVWDGGAISTLLSDEAGVGFSRIGFLFVLGGIIYIAYQDLSSVGGYKIGYLSGRQIKPLVYFTGSLPNFTQKTLYHDTILFVSGELIYSAGAVTSELPIQISQISDAGYSTVGGLAAPFGSVFVSSTDGGSNFRLAKFSSYDTACNWKSIIIPIVNGRQKGMIDQVIVLTNTLGANARADIQLEFNQNSSNSGTAKQITGTGKRRHVFRGFGSANEDFRIFLNWANGNATNDCPIREIKAEGHFVDA